MVSYFAAGTQWATKKGNPNVDPDNACGKKVAVQTGTVQVRRPHRPSQKCTSAGDNAITSTSTTARTRPPPRSSSARTTRCWPTPRSMAYAVQADQRPARAGRRRLRRGALRLRRGQGAGRVRARSCGAVKALIDDGTYKTILEEVGRRGRRDRHAGDQRPPADPATAAMPRDRRADRHRPSRSRRCRSATPAGGSRRPSSRVLVALFVHGAGHQRRVPVADMVDKYIFDQRVLRGRAGHAGADRAGDGARRRCSASAGGHAAVAEPGPVGGWPGSTSGSSAAPRSTCSCCSGA